MWRYWKWRFDPGLKDEEERKRGFSRGGKGKRYSLRYRNGKTTSGRNQIPFYFRAFSKLNVTFSSWSLKTDIILILQTRKLMLYLETFSSAEEEPTSQCKSWLLSPGPLTSRSEPWSHQHPEVWTWPTRRMDWKRGQSRGRKPGVTAGHSQPRNDKA